MREHAVAALMLAFVGCGTPPSDAGPSASARTSVLPAPPAREAESARAGSSSSAGAAGAQPGAEPVGCTFDWIELAEAFRVCPVFGGLPSPWTPLVSTNPKELVVASGASLRFTVALRGEGQGPWTADLDDRCGVALRPRLLDAREQAVDDSFLLFPPSCPGGRARVTLSARGAVSTRLDVKAVRSAPERVVVGHRTLPSGVVEDVVEMKPREVALAPGAYFIELQLPTSDGQVVKLPLKVTSPS